MELLNKSSEEILDEFTLFIDGIFDKDEPELRKSALKGFMSLALSSQEQTHHHQLQKAREEMLNELEYRLGDRPFQIGGEPKWDRGVMFQWQGVKNWIAEKRKAYHSELDQDKK